MYDVAISISSGTAARFTWEVSVIDLTGKYVLRKFTGTAEYADGNFLGVADAGPVALVGIFWQKMMEGHKNRITRRLEISFFMNQTGLSQGIDLFNWKLHFG
jgi:hypothetical protein